MILAFVIGVPVVLFVIWLFLWAADAWKPETCREVNGSGVRCTDRPGHRADSCTFPVERPPLPRRQPGLAYPGGERQ